VSGVGLPQQPRATRADVLVCGRMQTATCADAWPPCPAGPAGLAGDDLRQGHSLQPNGDLVEVLTLRASRPARPGRILGHERPSDGRTGRACGAQTTVPPVHRSGNPGRLRRRRRIARYPHCLRGRRTGFTTCVIAGRRRGVLAIRLSSHNSCGFTWIGPVTSPSVGRLHPLNDEQPSRNPCLH